MELVKTAHSLGVGEANFHLQFTPKYLSARRVPRRRSEAHVRGQLPRNGRAVRLRRPRHRVWAGPRPALVGACKNLSVSRLVQLLKGASARRLRAQCSDRFRDKLWGDSFWSGGYFFYRSVGATTNEAIRYSLETSQRKHWKAVDYDVYIRSKQQTLNGYAA